MVVELVYTSQCSPSRRMYFPCTVPNARAKTKKTPHAMFNIGFSVVIRWLHRVFSLTRIIWKLQGHREIPVSRRVSGGGGGWGGGGLGGGGCHSLVRVAFGQSISSERISISAKYITDSQFRHLLESVCVAGSLSVHTLARMRTP